MTIFPSKTIGNQELALNTRKRLNLIWLLFYSLSQEEEIVRYETDNIPDTLVYQKYNYEPFPYPDRFLKISEHYKVLLA